MKKIMTLCFFVLALTLGSQSMKAQSITDIKTAATERTQKLKELMKFQGDTEQSVYNIYLEYERTKQNLDKKIAAGQTVSDQDKINLENMLAERFKKLFTPLQYERYLAVTKSPK